MRERYSLRWLAWTVGVPLPVLKELSRNPGPHYHPYTKVSGDKRRRIDNPDKQLKAVQRHIRRRLLAPLPVADFVHGCIKDRSPLTNASPHLHQAHIASIDIKNCFPSITHDMVYAFWK